MDSDYPADCRRCIPSGLDVDTGTFHFTDNIVTQGLSPTSAVCPPCHCCAPLPSPFHILPFFQQAQAQSSYVLSSLPLRSTLTASAQGGEFPTTVSDGYEFGKGGYHIDLPVNSDAPLGQALHDEGRAATCAALSSAVRVRILRMSEFG